MVDVSSSPLRPASTTPQSLHVSLRQIYSRGMSRATPVNRSLNCKSPISKRTVLHFPAPYPPLGRSVGLVINSYGGGSFDERLASRSETISDVGQPAHIRPMLRKTYKRRVLSMSEQGSPFSVIGKQQLLSTLPPGRLQFLREKKLSTTFNPVRTHKPKEAKLVSRPVHSTPFPKKRGPEARPVTSVSAPRPRQFIASVNGLSGWEWDG